MRGNDIGAGVVLGIILLLVVEVILVMIFSPMIDAAQREQECGFIIRYADPDHSLRWFEEGRTSAESVCQLEVSDGLWADIRELNYEKP